MTVAAVLLDHSQILLIQHHADGSHKGGLWGLPAGKTEGQAERLALVRELSEETGLVTDPQQLISFPGSRWESQFGEKHYSMRAYLVSDWTGQLAERTAEGRPAWIAFADLAKLQLLPNIERAITIGQQLRGKTARSCSAA